jgi:hypothetical protein
MGDREDHAHTVSGAAWDQRDRLLGGRSSNPNLHYGYQQGQNDNVPNVPPIPQQYLQQQQSNTQAPRMGASNSYGQGQPPQGQSGTGQPQNNYANTPIDVPTLIATKGYNPPNFDIRPQFVSLSHLALCMLLILD